MVRQEHIAKMKLIGKLLDGALKNVPKARAAAIEYARKLTADAGLQELVRQSFRYDLAERDIKRAAQVVSKVEQVRNQQVVTPTPAPPVPTRTFTPEEIEDFKNEKLILHEDFIRLFKAGQWTREGRAAFLAGKPPVKVAVNVDEDKLRELIPYLDGINLGFVTFSRVPPHLRKIDGKPPRELLESAGIIDAKLYLTDKGKAWLNSESV